MIQSIAFTMYPVTNMERSRKFYEEVLGLKVSSTFGEQWIEYDLGGNTFAITTMNIGRTPGAKGARVGFEVTDFEAFTNGLKEKSVQVYSGKLRNAGLPDVGDRRPRPEPYHDPQTAQTIGMDIGRV
ncbi:MAG: VOC family protein [Candidatus Manganitrophus sp.]|nr:VOC family protein [Candidatus Manganitrophus sp.]